MKMTDDLADQLRNKLRGIISGYKINEDDAGWLEGLMAARLAADQQNGGGEVVAWEASDPADGVRWVTRSPRERDGWQGLGRTIRPLIYGDTPQPSIPAPAQQDGKASETIQTSNFPSPQFAPGRPQFAGGCFGFDITSFGENCPGLRMYVEDDGCWHYKTSFSTFWIDDLIGQLTAAKTVLAHPPHADQETQG